MTSGAITTEKLYKLTNTSLVVNRDLSQDEWLTIGRKLSTFRDATAWAIGDWLIYGKGRGEYGDAYALAQEATGRSYESLSQYSRVSASYEIDMRLPSVSWSHHREALRLPRARRWDSLRRASEKGWTRHEYAAHVGRLTETKALTETGSSAPKSQRWRQQFQKRLTICPACGHAFDRRAPSPSVEDADAKLPESNVPREGQ